MDLEKIAVFGTRHIQLGMPLYEGQEPTHTEFVNGEELAWYSTGKLEEALGQGYEVFVCSIRPVFGPHDRWWRDLVGDDHVLNAGRIMSAALTGDAMEAVYEPWKILFGRLGVHWPYGMFKDFDDPALWLSSRHGVKDGSVFAGHRLLC